MGKKKSQAMLLKALSFMRLDLYSLKCFWKICHWRCVTRWVSGGMTDKGKNKSKVRLTQERNTQEEGSLFRG